MGNYMRIGLKGIIFRIDRNAFYTYRKRKTLSFYFIHTIGMLNTAPNEVQV